MKKALLSLFSGCGGMDIGFEGGFKVPKKTINTDISKDWIDKEDDNFFLLKETIFQTRFANDIKKEAKVAWENYFGNKSNDDVNNIYQVQSIVDIVKQYKEGNKDILPSDIEIVTGGFPCQDFSVSGKRKGFNSHKDHNGIIIKEEIPSIETRGQLYMWMKEVIEITKPKIFIAENVKGLANLGEVKSIIQSDFSKTGGDGYIVLSPQVLHAGNFGVPQSRERIFFIGLRKSALKKTALRELQKEKIKEEYSPYPVPTHRLNGEMHFSSVEHLMSKFVSCRDILDDLEEPDLSKDPSQMNYSKAKFMGKHCQGQKEINLNKLAPTIRAEHHGNIEFRRLSAENEGKYIEELNKGKKERRLTLRECARIQTFPDNFNFVIPSTEKRKRFELSPSQGYKLVGNAVPPLLAYHIAQKIESNWTRYFKE